MRLLGAILFALSLGCATSPAKQRARDIKEIRCHKLHNCISRLKSVYNRHRKGLMDHCLATNPLVTKKSCKRFR